MKVLLIEDDENFAIRMREMLLSLGGDKVAVEYAARFDAGAAIARQWHPDVALLDLALQNRDGLETLAGIQTVAEIIPTIVLTGVDDEELTAAAVAAGAQDYLIKSEINQRALVRAIRYAIERKSGAARLDYHRQRQMVLHEINLAVTSALDVQTVLAAFFEKIGKLLPHLSVIVWLHQPETNLWRALASWQLDERGQRAIAAKTGSGLAQAVRAAGQPLVIENLLSDPRLLDPEVIRRNGLVSYLGIPLKIKDEQLGVISIFSKQHNQFDADEVDFLTALAGQVAVSLNHSRLYQRAQEQAIRLEKANREIIASRDKHQELMETINAIVWEADLSARRLTFISKRVDDLLGYGIEQSNRNVDFWLNLVHPDDRPMVMQRFTSQIETGMDFEIEHRLIVGGGRTVWVREIVRIVKDDGGVPVRLSGVAIDISESKETKEALYERYHEIGSLRESSQKVLEAEDVREASERILELAMSLGDYDMGIVRLLNPSGALETSAARGFCNPDAPARFARPILLHANKGAAATFARIISTKKSHIYATIDPALGFDLFRSDGAQSAIIVPIIAKDTALGILSVASRRKVFFQPTQVRLLETFGSHIGTVVQKAKLMDDITGNLRRLEVLHELNASITSTLDFDAVVSKLLDKILELFPDLATTLRVLNKETKELDPVACRNLDDTSWRRTAPRLGTRYELAVGAAKDPVVIEDCRTDSRVRFPQFIADNQLISYVGVPLYVRTEMVGALGFFSKRNHAFSAAEIEFFTMLGSHAAMAIHNARLFTDVSAKTRELAALNDVTSTASRSLDMVSLLHEVALKFTEIFDFGATRVFLFDDLKAELHLKASFETHRDFRSGSSVYQKWQGLTGTVGATGEAIVLSDIATDPRYEHLTFTHSAKIHNQKFAASFPIKYGDEVLGVLACAGRHSRKLSDHEIQLIVSMSNQIAIAIHNARLYAELEKQSREISALFDVTAAASQSLHMKQTLREVIRKVAEIFDFESTTLYLVDGQDDELHGEANYSAKIDNWDHRVVAKKGIGIVGMVAATGTAVVINDSFTDPRYDALSVSKFARNARQRFFACFPIKYQAEVLGVISCRGGQPRQLSAHEIRLIDSMTSQIAIAIHNAWLFDERVRQSRELTALHTVASAASESLDLPMVLQAALQKIADFFAFDATAAYLVNEDRDALSVRAVYDDPPGWLDSAGIRRFKLGVGITGTVASTGKAIVIANTESDPRYDNLSETKSARRDGWCFLAGFPINYKGRTLGVIMCVSKQPRQLTQDEAQLIASMSNQVAVAIENARLYEQTKQQTERLRTFAARQDAIREEERARISREIHDELGQALTAVKLDISAIGKKLRPNDSTVSDEIAVISRMIDTTIQSMRNIATRLRPDILDQFGLAAAIEWQVSEFRKRTGIACDFSTRPAQIHMDKNQSTALFRIVQEALTNIARHASATAVRIALEKRVSAISLRVEDNGVGIASEKITGLQSLGLLGMKERAGAVGGVVTIRRSPKKGTILNARIPMKRQKQAHISLAKET